VLARERLGLSHRRTEESMNEEALVGKVMTNVLAGRGVQLLSDKIGDVLSSAVE
jgi:hypothetical protein